MRRALLLPLGILWLASPAWATQLFVRDEVRINLRSGPGDQYRIIRVLKSGDELSQIAVLGDWVQVKGRDGREGYVPTAYVTDEIPASKLLPELRSKYDHAQKEIATLRVELTSQTQQVAEVQSLRQRNRVLESENAQLTGASNARQLAMGAMIVAAGVLIGIFWPRGSGARTRIRL
jgi:SH3 domain protein